MALYFTEIPPDLIEVQDHESWSADWNINYGPDTLRTWKLTHPNGTVSLIEDVWGAYGYIGGGVDYEEGVWILECTSEGETIVDTFTLRIKSEPTRAEKSYATFLVEFPSGDSIVDFRATTINPHPNPKGAIIQSIQTGTFEGVTNYWTSWGGGYEGIPENTFLTLFIDQFLVQVDTIQDLILVNYSYLIVGNQIYFHIPFYIWQLEEALSRIEQLTGFSTNVPDPMNPSDDTFRGIRYPARMRVPSLSMKIGNPVNGINISPVFSINLENSDGYFDNYDSTAILNNPVTVRRSNTVPATYDTFTRISVSEIENIKLSMDNILIQGADFLRTLEEPATRTIKEAEIADLDDEMPIAYGYIKDAPFIEIYRQENETTGDIFAQYILCDPDYYWGVINVQNKDGDTLFGYTVENGILTFEWNKDDEIDGEPNSADFNGKILYDINRLGDIIKHEISTKTSLVYTETFWNQEETDNYILNSPTLSLYFSSGSVKDIVTKALKNDVAFLIQQTTGKLTIRKWGQKYNTHKVPSWTISKRPSRVFSDYKYYYSSVLIDYGQSIEKDSRLKYLDTSVETETVAKWKKKARKTFETNLRNESQAQKFSNDLLSRFANRAQLWDVTLGLSVVGMELLDTVQMEMIIADQENGVTRKLSDFNQWIITGVNPSQDMLSLEEDSYEPIGPTLNRTLGPLSHPFINYEGGYLSHPTNQNTSGILSKNAITESEI